MMHIARFPCQGGAQRLERHSVGSDSDQRNLFAAANSIAWLLRQEIPPLAYGSLRNDIQFASLRVALAATTGSTVGRVSVAGLSTN